MARKYDSVNMEEDHDQLCTPSVQTDSDREEGAASVFRSPIPGQTTGIDHFGQLTDSPTGFGPIRSDQRENRHNLAPNDGLEEIRLTGHRMAIERGTFDGSHSSRALDDYDESAEFTERKLRVAEKRHEWMLEMEELKIMEETHKHKQEEIVQGKTKCHFTTEELMRIIEERKQEDRQKQEVQRKEQVAREERQLRINEEQHRVILEEDRKYQLKAVKKREQLIEELQEVEKELSSRTVPMENRGQQKTQAPREIRRSSGYMSSTSEEEESQQTWDRHVTRRRDSPHRVTFERPVWSKEELEIFDETDDPESDCVRKQLSFQLTDRPVKKTAVKTDRAPSGAQPRFVNIRPVEDEEKSEEVTTPPMSEPLMKRVQRLLLDITEEMSGSSQDSDEGGAGELLPSDDTELPATRKRASASRTDTQSTPKTYREAVMTKWTRYEPGQVRQPILSKKRPVKKEDEQPRKQLIIRRSSGKKESPDQPSKRSERCQKFTPAQSRSAGKRPVPERWSTEAVHGSSGESRRRRSKDERPDDDSSSNCGEEEDDWEVVRPWRRHPREKPQKPAPPAKRSEQQKHRKKSKESSDETEDETSGDTSAGKRRNRRRGKHPPDPSSTSSSSDDNEE
jgi:hypothetical protein